MIRRRQGLSNCLFPQYTSILLSSWNHQISKITSFKSRVMVLFVCNMQIMLCNQCHTWLTNLLNYYNYMLKAKDYNVLYYFLKKKNYDRNGISYEATVIRGNGPHSTGAWVVYVWCQSEEITSLSSIWSRYPIYISAKQQKQWQWKIPSGWF